MSVHDFHEHLSLCCTMRAPVNELSPCLDNVYMVAVILLEGEGVRWKICRKCIWVDCPAINNDCVWINSALLSESVDLNIPNRLAPSCID